MNLTAEQKQITIMIHEKVCLFIAAGPDETAVDEAIVGIMPDYAEGFHSVLLALSHDEINQLCVDYPGFYRFAKMMERIAEGCKAGIFDDIIKRD